jgi:hypothetical protein
VKGPTVRPQPLPANHSSAKAFRMYFDVLP